jgi:hypothetical protein
MTNIAFNWTGLIPTWKSRRDQSRPGATRPRSGCQVALPDTCAQTFQIGGSRKRAPSGKERRYGGNGLRSERQTPHPIVVSILRTMVRHLDKSANCLDLARWPHGRTPTAPDILARLEIRRQ